MPAKVSLDIIGYAFLDAIAIGENYDPIDYNELVGGGKFEGYDAFPDWPGLRFPTGMSHAAGRYQFQPATWAAVANVIGLQDFQPQSQDIGAWWLAQDDYNRRTRRYLHSDLRNRKFDALVHALQPTWSSISARTADQFLGAWTARRMAEL